MAPNDRGAVAQRSKTAEERVVAERFLVDRYINTDDCWMNGARDPVTHALVPTPAKFPSGFKNMIGHMHSIGQKFGLYTARGDKTCGGFAASCGHEALDATTFAGWGVDFVKDDVSCHDIACHGLHSSQMAKMSLLTGLRQHPRRRCDRARDDARAGGDRGRSGDAGGELV